MKVLYNKKQTAEKKNLINRISELTGVKPKYLGAPTMVYQIGSYQVDREGNLIAPDDQDAMELVEALKLYGFEEAILEQEAVEEEETAVEAAVEETAEEPTAATENAETDVAEKAAKEVIAGATEEIHEVKPAEEPIQQNVAVEATTDAEPVSVSIAFPLSKHTSHSIRNLVNLIYSRGVLVSKAVQGEFSAPQELVDVFGDKDPVTTEEQVERLRKLEAEGVAMKGIRFDEDKVTFTGFPETSDADTLLAFQQLAEKMNKQAISQKRIQARVVDEENEKYSMRTWLVRIGMGGSEYKKTRNLLMKHLAGHTAFKTPADAERWKVRQAELKAERLAAKAE